MTKSNLFINALFLLAILLSAISQCLSALSDKRLCYDPDCSVPISLARTSIKYNANEPGLLSFGINVKVTVYSKEAGSREDLWGAEINGKRGYVPKGFLKEYKVLQRDLKYVMPINQPPGNNNVSNEKHQPKKKDIKTELFTNSSEISNARINNLNLKSIEELPHDVTNVTPPYEIIDGTTLHLDSNEPLIQPTFVAEVVEKTKVPNKQDTVNIDSRVSSNSKEIKSIFKKDDELLQEIINDKLENKNQDISDKIDIENLVISSEENLNLPEVTGVRAPQLVANGNLKSDFVNELSHTTENIKDDTSAKVQGTQSLDKLNVVNLTALNISGEKLNVNTSDIKAEKNVDIKFNEKDVVNLTALNISGEKLNMNTSDIKAEKNVDIKFNEKDVVNPTALNISEEKLNMNTSDIKAEKNVDIKFNEKDNINLTQTDVNNNTETSPENIKSLGELDDSNGGQLLENAIQVGAEQNELKEGSLTFKEDVTAKQVDLSVSVESNVENTLEAKLPADNINKILAEKKLDTSQETFSEIKLVSSIENVTVENAPDVVISLSNSDDVNVNITEESNVTVSTDRDSNEGLHNNLVQSVQYEVQHNDVKEALIVPNETLEADDISKDTNTNTNTSDDSHFAEVVPTTLKEDHIQINEESNLQSEQLLYSNQNTMNSENIVSINEFHNRNLLNAEISDRYETEDLVRDETDHVKNEISPENGDEINVQDKSMQESLKVEDIVFSEETAESTLHEVQAVSFPDVCTADNTECTSEDNTQNDFVYREQSQNGENAIMEGIKLENNYWLTLMYLSVTATATLMFSLGYYYIENMRRDGQLIAKINKLEKDLLVSTKECTILNENLKLTKDKLTSIEDESFGSNEMVLSLKADLEASQKAKTELEEQVTMLEKDLESATEAGLELERMLREVLSSNNEVNPLAQSVEDLQARLNVQQAANESLTNALNLKTQENETLSTELASFKRKYEELEIDLSRVTEKLKLEETNKNSLEQTLSGKIQQLEMQIKEISTQKANLQKELKGKEVEIKDLEDVISRMNSNNLDLGKLYDVSHIKAEATAVLEERNELKVRLAEVEGAHSLLEEHMKVIKEEIVTLSEQCKVAEKEKKDAETKLEVLSNFFNEKEAQRQKEEAIWLQQQGEVLSTVERIQVMQNEIQNYKQQIEMLKREILDQETEHKNQISVLEMKAHEQWVIARQVERRLKESKVEAGQLRNRLTLIEKNINDADSEAKLHRLEANGETVTSPPLFIGAESSSSPIMFSGSSNVPPPPPPSYLHSLFPPYLPPPLPNASGVPPYEVSQRPPPLGGRLSSPPPMPLHPPTSSRYDNAGSPPPMSPHLLPHFEHRSPPPPFTSDYIHRPLPPPGSILPPPLLTTHSWGEESLPPPRDSGFHLPQRERVRNHKGSLHSSGESLDKAHHNNKV